METAIKRHQELFLELGYGNNLKRLGDPQPSSVFYKYKLYYIIVGEGSTTVRHATQVEYTV